MATVRDIEIHDSAAQAAQAAEELQDAVGEKMVLNMGPSHPATHGVLRIVLELDGEIITKADPDVGYLHRGDEKIAENMTYTQFIPYTDRLDYLAPLANNVAFALAVEKLLGIEKDLPPRCQYIRVMCAELARISAHLLGLGAFAMDLGAVTVFLLTFTEREKIYNLAEAICGARFTTRRRRTASRRLSAATCGGRTRSDTREDAARLRRQRQMQVPVDQRVTEEERADGAAGEERPERNGQARRGATGHHQRDAH